MHQYPALRRCLAAVAAVGLSAWAVSALPSHHEVVGGSLEKLQRLPRVGYSLKSPVLPLEQPGQKFVDGRIFVDHQKSAWTHPFTVADPLKRRNLRPPESISLPG